MSTSTPREHRDDPMHRDEPLPVTLRFVTSMGIAFIIGWFILLIVLWERW